MQTGAEKKQQETGEYSSSGKKTGSGAVLRLEDNRPGTGIQQKLQVAAENSPKTRQINQFQAMADQHSTRQQPIQKKENTTGLPDDLKSGIEHLSGYSLDDVRVHYNSPKPAQLQAHAYAQGTGIHIAPGQEKHLAHEAWHVVQQKQGKVQPTTQLRKGVQVNDNAGLEKEADVMGNKALQSFTSALLSGMSRNTKGTGEHSAAITSPFITQRMVQMNSDAMPVQRAIAAAPVAVDQAGMLAAGGVNMDMGNTDPVTGHILPAYNIVTAPDGAGGFQATVNKTADAFEGNSNAVYLQRGIFPSGLMLTAGILGPFAAGPANRQVYADLSAVNSNLSRLAEQEHLDDLRRAFQITLDIADWAFDQAVLNGPYAGATAPLAQAAAEAGIDNFIAARAAILGTAPFTTATDLTALYQAKQALTHTGRDSLGFHTFNIDRINVSNSPLAKAMRLLTLIPFVEKKDFREVIPGPNFNVPGPASNVLVV